MSQALVLYLFFFFSSRRRHTRLQGDWSSDVCSSDLRGDDDHPARDGVIRSGHRRLERVGEDRKSTRLNSSHLVISYAVFCLKKKKKKLRLIATSHQRTRYHCSERYTNTRCP